jgi:hypothetical protein
MARIHPLTVAALFLAAALVPTPPASAGFFTDWLGHGDCPPPSYTPLRYWTPELMTVHDCIHGPRLSVYAPNRHPEIPPTVTVLKYHCPAAVPTATFVPVPTPPETSRFRY